MSEEQRYSGKDYVPKANQNKGQRKQEAWVDMVRGITEKKANISKGVKDILTKISAYDNIPRKKAKFLNFMKNSFRYMKVNELEEAWVLLEEAINETKKSPEGNQKPEDPKPEMNGKRKLEVTESTEEPVQKKKKKSKDPEDQDQENDQEVSSTTTDSKFKWQDAIKNILSAKNNEIKLKKLKKKVLKQYQSFTGITAVGDKIENKFNKKIAKLKGVVVDNDRVRLVEA
jgi:cell growth-regulating nucleolar protein